MTAVDFEAWAVPDLTLTFKGRSYTVPPPDVDRAKVIMASALRAEVNLGIVAGPVDEEIDRILATVGDSHPALTDGVYEQMAADGVPVKSIDRMSYFAVFYWARSAEYAGWIATRLWQLDSAATPSEKAGGAEAAPKG